ncbi:MAG: YgiT-type zinc finger protein [Anaerolineae bacterium]|nr:YgiT-type zinc finger protein [Anaerolineae bacterium]
MTASELEAKTVTWVQRYQGQWYVIENLPPMVCKQCAETYFTPDAYDRVVELITSGTPPARMETVAVYDAASCG